MDSIIKTFIERTKNLCYCFKNCNHYDLKMYDLDFWLCDITKLDTKNKQGIVYKARLRETNEIIIIKYIKTTLLPIGQIEINNGIQLNTLNTVFFGKLLGFFYTNFSTLSNIPKEQSDILKYSDSSKNVCILTRFETGIPLKILIHKLSLSDYVQILLQICMALEAAQEKLSFTHYDLHTNNIIIRKIIKSNSLFDEYDCRFQNTYQPIIIDFGMSYVKNCKIFFKSCPSKMMLNCCQPGYDLYTFLLFCLDEIEKNQKINESVRVFILKILTDFYQDKNLGKNYLEMLRNGGANLKTPKEMFNFLKFNNDIAKKSIYDRCRLSLFKIQQPKISKNYDSFVELLYDKQPIEKYDKKVLKLMILNDVKNDKPIKKEVEQYFKIKFLKLSSKINEYKEWEKKFYPYFKNYWLQKLEKDRQKRSCSIEKELKQQ